MSLIPDTTLLSMLRAVGAEKFEGLDGTFEGVFEQPYAGVELQDDVIASRKPVITARTADLEAASVTVESEITRVSDGTTYRVTRLAPDGEGVTQVFVNDT